MKNKVLIRAMIDLIRPPESDPLQKRRDFAARAQQAGLRIVPPPHNMVRVSGLRLLESAKLIVQPFPAAVRPSNRCASGHPRLPDLGESLHPGVAASSTE